MSGELYQLVAIAEDGVEQVIELNNDNKKNKGLLSFIDSGTTYMKDENALKEYLFRKGKINSLNITFAIKYNNRGDRYLPLIYNDPEFRTVALNANNERKLESYARYLIDKIDFELCNSDFYQIIMDLNEEVFSQISNGNYLNEHFLSKLKRFYELFGFSREDYLYKEKHKKELVDSLKTYKTIRTLYIFYKIYLNCKLNNQMLGDNHEYDIPNQLKYQFLEEIKKSDVGIPEELEKAYEQGGMDAVLAIADAEEIIKGGYKFR